MIPTIHMNNYSDVPFCHYTLQATMSMRCDVFRDQCEKKLSLSVDSNVNQFWIAHVTERSEERL